MRVRLAGRISSRGERLEAEYVYRDLTPMEMSAAAKLADFVSSHLDALQHRIQRALPAPYAELTAPFLRDWLESQVAFLKDREDRTNEWVALLTETMRAKGASIHEILGQVRTFRQVIVDFYQAETSGAADAALFALLLEVQDRYIRQVAEHCAQREREEIASERRRQRAMAESLDCPFVVLDPEGGIVLANSRFAQELGLSPDSFEGREFASFCEGATATEIRRMLRQRRVTGAQTFQGRFGTRNTRGAPATFSVRPLFDALGCRDSLAITIRCADTKRAQIQDYLRYVAQEIIAVLPTAVQVIDRRRHVLFVNTAGRELSLPHGDPNLPYCCRLITGGDLAKGTCACEQVFETGKTFLTEVRCEKEGVSRWYRLVLVPLRIPQGEVEQIACAVRDVTEDRALERGLENQILQQQRSSVASQVAVTVAHQLRNPLGVIVGFAQMLAKGLPPEQVPGTVDRVLRNGLRCKEIVEDLLRFGQGFPGERVVIDLPELVRSSVQPMFPASQNSRIVWLLSQEAAPVECVPEQLARVFVCLLDNALREGATQVRFEVTVEERHVLVRVRDNGPGVPEALRDRLFEPFFTSHYDEGAVGLGLSLSQAVLHDYGGRIYLEETSDPGASFVVRLPLIANAKEASVDTDASKSPADTPPKPRGHVLVVDDEVDLLEMLQMVLEMRGHTVTPATSAGEAITLLPAAVYDALVLDVQLPGDLNGPQLYEYLSQSNPELAQHTLFITADTMNYETRKFLERVKRPSMEKPFLVEEFVLTVERLLERPSAAKPGK